MMERDIMAKMKEAIDVRRLDNSHYGIELRDGYGKEVFKHIFDT